MLHKYLLTLALAVSFTLSQLGLMVHDVTHINSNLIQNNQAQSSQEQAQLQTDAIDTHVTLKLAAQPAQLPFYPNNIDYHACEKCTSYAGVAIAIQQAPLVFHFSALAIAPAHHEKYILHSLKPLTRSARAPPVHLV